MHSALRDRFFSYPLIMVLFLSAFAIAFTPHRAKSDETQGAVAFIENLGETVIGSLTDKKMSVEDREAVFRTLLKESLDLGYVARFVLGPYRRQATDEEFGLFSKILEENIVKNYAWRFRNYSGQKLEILDVQPSKRESQIVKTELSQVGNAPPIRVNWRIHRVDTHFKIIDINVEGISMMVTQRDEYVGFMRNNGGVSALIKALEKQNEALAARNKS